MIDFYLKIRLRIEDNRIEDYQIKDYKIADFKIEDIKYKKMYEWGELIFWGDPIGADDLIEAEFKPDTLISNISGHYYYLIINKKENIINIGNSLFSILPVYYFKNNGELHISNSYKKISSITNNKVINKRFILENILFNYQLFNNTFFENIFLLNSNSYIEINNNNFTVKKHTNIQDYFVSNPLRKKKAIPQLTDLFISSSKRYYPDEFYFTSLTGGFDGRTLTACGLYHKKHFETYSFGTEDSNDIKIAMELSESTGIKHNMILLDDNYVSENSFDNGVEFINNSEGNASFARAHYLYAVKQLPESSKYLITGNFGSEVFRAAHIAGEVISPNLYNLFNNSCDDAITKIINSTEFRFLNQNAFKNEWSSLCEDFKKMPVYNKEYDTLTLNQKLYIVVFEEIFRKYFGAEMINQFKYLNSRTPFIDFYFLKELLKTELPGVYSDFFEHNPLKRYKGQILYSHIINKAYPVFSDIKTDKGYKPDDLIKFWGKINIIKKYLKKEYNKKFVVTDPFSVKRSFENNKSKYSGYKINEEIFNKSVIDSNFENIENKRIFNIVLSQIYWYNHNI